MGIDVIQKLYAFGYVFEHFSIGTPNNQNDVLSR